jgi:hypothetical protein
MTKSKRIDGPGPWWLFGTFDEYWKLLDVTCEADRSSAVADCGFGKKMRFRDEPIVDSEDAKAEVRRIVPRSRSHSR